MEELIKELSNKELKAMKEQHKDNETVVKLIDGILEGRVKEEAEAKAKENFTKVIGKVFAKLPHPEDIHNIYVRWCEVDVEVEDAEAEEVEVEVVKTPAVLDKDGTITTPAVMATEKRKPMVTIKQYQWVVELNHSVVVKSGASGNSPATSKRAIKVMKRNGLQLEDKGNYANASIACKSLGLAIGGDSATRVLARDGYITEPYEGTDYTTS